MDLQLLAALLVGVALIIVLILRTRLDAFLALLVAAIATGLLAGVAPAETAEMITTGFGNTLASIGIVIGLGVMIGKLLELSGAADALAAMFVRLAGSGREDWAMASTGALVSIPVFCDSGYVIMHPLSRSLARRTAKPFVTLALALGAGMTITHHLVPPTPGPLAVAGILGVDLGRLIVVGLLMGLPMIAVVVFYARWIGPRLEGDVDPDIRAQVERSEHPPIAGASDDPPSAPTASRTARRAPAPGVGRSLAPLLVPLLLIVGNTVTAAVAEGTPAARTMSFIGHPVVALLVGLVIALYTLVAPGIDRATVVKWLHDAAASAGLIILITGAGGALGNVLRESGVGDAMAEGVAAVNVPAFIIPFLIATFVRFAQGSGTVAMITAASLTAPLIGGLGLDPLVAALGACIGSIFFSYFNDSYFWVVTKFIGLEGTPALRGWSGITTALWAFGFVELVIVALILR